MMRLSALVLVAIVAAGLTADGAIIDVTGDTADTTIGLNAEGIPGVHWNAATTMIIGDDNAAYGKDDVAAVLVFQLPDLGGEDIAAANLGCRMSWGQHAISGGVDVYALRYDAGKSVLAADYGWGQPLTTGGGTLIQDDFVLHGGTSQPLATFETDDAADAALAAWLADIYDAGAVAGDYVFLRFNGDRQSANSFSLISANHATEMKPTLTITTVPEPATLGVLALGALAVIRRRR
ncbi:MAG: PEP-CTERM sorting domain-containing protein [Planctomycetes bacterium]|nr:PEP-CTERM sorting domain-containing protein [Planctomycetota bacterium]